MFEAERQVNCKSKPVGFFFFFFNLKGNSLPTFSICVENLALHIL